MNIKLLSERISRQQQKLSLDLDQAVRSLSWYLSGCRTFPAHVRSLQQAHTWCFLVGCNNSGTTLLQELLEDIFPISTFPHEGQRYTRTLERASRRGHERVWTEFIDDLRLTSADSYEIVPRLMHDWFRELPKPVNRVIVEKTTANAVRMPWLQTAFPGSRFIGLVRNGYAVTEGILRKGRKPVDRGARHWNRVNQIMLEDASQIQHFMLLSYEELTRQPETVLDKIAEFIGIDGKDYLKQPGNSQKVSTIQNMNQKSIDKLSSDEMKTISHEAAEMLSRLGYARGRPFGSE